ncbi:MAG: glycosyltransferase family 39 protein [Patescibacteria group bacterium]
MIILILILGLVLRLVKLNQSLWLDEAVQAITSQGSFNDIFSELTGDFHPPLYHLLMWTWVHLFGSSEIILRLPSVIFGVATIYVVYLIARQVISRKLEIGNWKLEIPEIVALFLVTAPFHIYYSQEARPYALVALLATCSMYFFLKEQWKRYILATTLMLYSSYYGFLVLLAQFISMIIINRKNIATLLHCYIATLFLFLPCLPLLTIQLQVGSQAIQILPEWGRLVNVSFLKALPLTFIKFTLGRITIFNKTLYALTAGILFLVYGSIIAKGFFRGKKFLISNYQLLITLWLFVPVCVAWLISFFIPNYQPFRLLLVLPAFYLLLAGGVASIKNRSLAFFSLLVILLTSFFSLLTYYLNPYFHREDWRGVVRFIETQEKPRVAILPSQTSDWAWRYYSEGKVRLVGISPGARRVMQVDFNNLAIKQSSNQAIYYIPYLQPVFDPEEKIVSWLGGLGYVKIKEISFNQIPVWEYRLLR